MTDINAWCNQKFEQNSFKRNKLKSKQNVMVWHDCEHNKDVKEWKRAKIIEMDEFQ